jgi:hypothetical protein
VIVLDNRSQLTVAIGKFLRCRFLLDAAVKSRLRPLGEMRTRSLDLFSYFLWKTWRMLGWRS